MTDPQTEKLLGALLPRVVAWVREREAAAEALGRPLNPDEAKWARGVGVEDIPRVRRVAFTEPPAPADPELIAVADTYGFDFSRSRGMALGYSVWLAEEAAEVRECLAHELRHVAQLEWLGSHERYLEAYLRELARFRYGPGPLESDARARAAAILAQA